VVVVMFMRARVLCERLARKNLKIPKRERKKRKCFRV